jgi:hypothetical protein
MDNRSGGLFRIKAVNIRALSKNAEVSFVRQIDLAGGSPLTTGGAGGGLDGGGGGGTVCSLAGGAATGAGTGTD